MRAPGGRVIAVGTTVVRAPESGSDAAGVLAASAGWTQLVIKVEEAAGGDLIERSRRETRRRGGLWHEFGDVHLILP